MEETGKTDNKVGNRKVADYKCFGGVEVNWRCPVVKWRYSVVNWRCSVANYGYYSEKYKYYVGTFEYSVYGFVTLMEKLEYLLVSYGYLSENSEHFLASS